MVWSLSQIQMHYFGTRAMSEILMLWLFFSLSWPENTWQEEQEEHGQNLRHPSMQPCSGHLMFHKHATYLSSSLHTASVNQWRWSPWVTQASLSILRSTKSFGIDLLLLNTPQISWFEHWQDSEIITFHVLMEPKPNRAEFPQCTSQSKGSLDRKILYEAIRD